MVVVAIGSRLMKDDAIGVLVAEHIQKNLIDHGINVVIAETDFEYGISGIENDDRVIVLDAFFSGKKPGQITAVSLQEIGVEDIRTLSHHEHNLIGFFKQPHKVHACLIGIEVADIDYGLELSAELRLRFNDICRSIEQIILKDQCN